MRPASSQRGYALLAALVVTALAAVFAAAAVAAVSARQSIVGADVANARAQAGAKQALARVCLELRRHPAALEGELSSAATTAGDESWQASWASAGAGIVWPAVVVRAEATRGAARGRRAVVPGDGGCRAAEPPIVRVAGVRLHFDFIRRPTVPDGFPQGAGTAHCLKI